MAKTTPHKFVRIDEDTHKAIAKAAREMRVSVTWLVNDLLRKAVSTARVAEYDDP